MSETAAAAIWLFGLVAWAAIRLPHRRRAARTETVVQHRTAGDRLALAAATLGLSVIPGLHLLTGFPEIADYRFRPWMGWAGLVVQISCLALFFQSHRQLGRNWSVSLEIRRKHHLVTDGLYRYVRHPMYSSFWLWAIAQALLLPNFVAGSAGLIGVGILYFSRVGREEQLMAETFGSDYDAYRSRTGRLFPRIWGG